MRRSSLLVLFALMALILPANASAHEGHSRTVGSLVATQTIVQEAPPGRDKIYCDGYAPLQALCTGSFVLSRDFDIVVAVANTFWGAIHIRGDTATGSVTIYCEQMTAPLDCWWRHDGFFMEGQVFTLRGIVTGFGYWRIRVP